MPLYSRQGATGSSGGAVIHSGSGAPAASLGTNGDLYVRVDGGSGTVLYQKRAGSWVATSA